MTQGIPLPACFSSEVYTAEMSLGGAALGTVLRASAMSQLIMTLSVLGLKPKSLV